MIKSTILLFLLRFIVVDYVVVMLDVVVVVFATVVIVFVVVVVAVFTVFVAVVRVVIIRPVVFIRLLPILKPIALF